jgi:hypothetical protein
MVLLTKLLDIPLTQSQADFVIPDVDEDRRLCIDPFLLYKSKDPRLRALHERLVAVFNAAFAHFRAGRRNEMDRLIDFPEVNEIAFGYSEGRIQGTGMGVYLNRLVAETLGASSALVERGIRHIEELQLVSVHIGPDRVSDMAANLLKAELARYTREQCELWGIPFQPGVPLEHVFDLESFEWHDEYADLPVNPKTGRPLLFVPRRMVRILPWINFEDYKRNEFRLFLRPAGARPLNRLPGTKTPHAAASKAAVVEVTRREIRLLDDYIVRKERESDQATPQLGNGRDGTARPRATELMTGLRAISPGTKDATAYQREMSGLLNYLFEPELTDGKLEERTIHGTERRDIVYTNEADRSFWQYIRQAYGCLLVMFEAKNVATVSNEHINQTATYLGDRIGRFGVILTRHPAKQPQVLKAMTVYNDSQPRKVILILHDADIERMLQLKERGDNPTKYMQQLYRTFKLKLQ